MSNVNVDFGNIATELIKRKGMTKRAISEKSGIPYSTLNFMLRGQRSVTLEDVLAIAEAMESAPHLLIPHQLKQAEEAESALAGKEKQ